MNTAKKPQSSERMKRYKCLGIAKRQLEQVRPGFCEEDYRQILFMHGAKQKGGTFSASTMTIAQMDNALKHCQQLGFKLSKKVQRETPKMQRDWREPRVAKLNAMWIALADAGEIDDRSEQAMQHWCQNRVPGLVRFEWITSAQLNTAIEMMKQFCQRCGLTMRTTPTKKLG